MSFGLPTNVQLVEDSATGTVNSATPGTATQVAGSDGTNLRALKVSSAGVLSVDNSANTQPVSGTVRVTGNAGANFDGPTGSAVPANIVLAGARAATANPTNATGGNAVSLMADKAGRLVVTEGNVRELIAVQQTSFSGTGETTIVTAAGASVFADLMTLIITTANTAAATLTLKDSTAGTTRAVLNYPNAASAPSTPLVINFNPPLPQASANNNWTLTASAAAGNVNVTAIYAKNT